MNRTLSELNKEELRKVWDKNEGLRDRVTDSLNDEIQNYTLEQYLNCFDHSQKGCRRMSDISISYSLDRSGYDNYLRIKNRIQFIEDLKDCQHAYFLLSQEDYNEEHLNKLAKKQEVLDNNWWYDLSKKDCDRLEKWLDKQFETLETIVYKELRSLFDTLDDEEELFYYFCENELEYMVEDFYVDEQFTLYEHIEYEKSYA